LKGYKFDSEHQDSYFNLIEFSLMEHLSWFKKT